MTVLFCGAHPDDVELSAGGLAYKLRNEGVYILDLTLGELATNGTAEERMIEAKNAAKILNAKKRYNLNLGDSIIENSVNNRLKIIEVIRKVRCDILVIPYYHDRHPDHIKASKILKDSAFYSGLIKIKTPQSKIPNQKPHRPKLILYYPNFSMTHPDIIIDITKEFPQKMKAVKAFKSQFYNRSKKKRKSFISTKDFLDSIEARAKYLGSQIGVKYGEAYFIDKPFRLDNPFDLWRIK